MVLRYIHSSNYSWTYMLQVSRYAIILFQWLHEVTQVPAEIVIGPLIINCWHCLAVEWRRLSLIFLSAFFLCFFQYISSGISGKVEVSYVVYKVGESMQELIKLWTEYESSQSQIEKNGESSKNGPTLEIRISSEYVTATNRQVSFIFIIIVQLTKESHQLRSFGGFI